MNYLISVIIPIYNTKSYLQNSIDSIISQKEFIKEIILVNDGSTDDSGSYIDEHYGDNSLIKIIHSENYGQGYARNLGMEMASGEFIYFFDSDDIASHDLFQQFTSNVKENKDLELFCFSGKSFLDDKSQKSDLIKLNYLSEFAYTRKIDDIFETGEEAFCKLVDLKTFFAGPPLYIVKRSVLVENNLKFLPIKFEDEEFTHRLFMHAGKTVVTNHVLFIRRVRTGSTMQIKKTLDDLLGYFKTTETLKNLISSEMIKPYTKKLLKKRIKTFITIIIDLKISNNIKFNRKEKRIFKQKIKPYLISDTDLMRHYLFYPIEYKLRKAKKIVFNKFIHNV